MLTDQDMTGAYDDNDTSLSVSNNCSSIPSAPTDDSPTSPTLLFSSDVECINSKSVSKIDVRRTSTTVFPLENADHAEVAWHKLSLKEAGNPQTSTSSDLNATEIVSETPSSVLDGCMIVEFEQKQENLLAAEKRGGEVPDNVLSDSNSDRGSSVSTAASLQEMPESVNHEVKGQTPEKIIAAQLDTSAGINSDVERTRVLSVPSISSSNNEDSAVGIFDQVPSTIPVETKSLPVDSAKSNCELTCSKEIDVNGFSTLPLKTISIPQVFSEIEQNMNGVAVDQSLGVPRWVSESKDKPEPIKAKTNSKKKIRFMIPLH